MSNPRPKFIDEMNKNNKKDKEPSLLPPTQFINPRKIDSQAQDLIDKRNPDKAFLGSRKDAEKDLFPHNPLNQDSDDEFDYSAFKK